MRLAIVGCVVAFYLFLNWLLVDATVAHAPCVNNFIMTDTQLTSSMLQYSFIAFYLYLILDIEQITFN